MVCARYWWSKRKDLKRGSRGIICNTSRHHQDVPWLERNVLVGRVKRDVAEYAAKCLKCQQIKVEHQCHGPQTDDQSNSPLSTQQHVRLLPSPQARLEQGVHWELQVGSLQEKGFRQPQGQGGQATPVAHRPINSRPWNNSVGMASQHDRPSQHSCTACILGVHSIDTHARCTSNAGPHSSSSARPRNRGQLYTSHTHFSLVGGG